MAPCREGRRLEHEPVAEPNPSTEEQQWLIEFRADVQAKRDEAERDGEEAADCVRHALSCPDRVGGWTFTKPKGKGKRSIALPPPLIVLLKLHKEAQRLEREAAGDRWQGWGLVWCTPDGNPIDAGDDWKQLLQLAEIDKDARVHDARHTAATLLLEQRVDIRMIQAVPGHSQLTTTKRYTHITETPAIEAAGRMGRALWDA